MRIRKYQSFVRIDGLESRRLLAVSTPFGGTPIPITAAGSTTIQLENFDNGGEGVAYHDVDAANLGGSYRTTGVDIQPTTDTGGGFNIGWTRAGEWLKYSVDVAVGGTYTLDFRLATPASGGRFHLELDGANVTGPIEITSTDGWQNWTTIPRTNVSLPAGQHVLRLVMDAAGTNGAIANLNWLRIGPAQSPFKGSPFAISTTPVTIQVEDFDKGGEGIAVHDVDTANLGGQYRPTEPVDIQPTTDTGGGFNVGWTRTGEWLEYSIDLTTHATYNFDFRVASPGTGGNFHAELDGLEFTGELTVPNTGGWQKWQTVTTSIGPLPLGKHVLRLSMDYVGTTGGVGNFNFIRITPFLA
jgi:hypothetical protein